MNLFPSVYQPKPTDNELVLRMLVIKLEDQHEKGWLYQQCKSKGLLEIYNDYLQKGIFHLLSMKQQRYPDPKLTIELVPKTCWFSNVRSCVSKKDWETLKKMTFLKAENKCEICGGKGKKWPVECHEIWEYNDAKKIQKLAGLIALCPSCHGVKHIGYAQLQGKFTETLCHLAIVNRWSYEKAQDYTDDQFELWEKRSQTSWVLDTSYLDQYNIQIRRPERTASDT